MGFLKPKAPELPPPPPPPPNLAADPLEVSDDINRETAPYGRSSLISTTAQGLKRRASVQRTSLIGGS